MGGKGGTIERQTERERGRGACVLCVLFVVVFVTQKERWISGLDKGGSSVKGAGARVVVDSLPKDLQELLRSCLVPLEDAAKMYTK